MPLNNAYAPRPEARLVGQSGFTFIEVIASLALLGILTAIFGMGLVAAMESYYFSRTNVATAQKGQLAMHRLSRELAELTAIHQVGSNYIVYERIENNGGGVPEARTMGIYYDPEGGVRLFSDLPDTGPLSAGSTGGDVLCDAVAAFALAYYRGSETWSFGQDIQLLSTIGITLDLNRADDATHSHQFNTLVHLRNTSNAGGASP